MNNNNTNLILAVVLSAIVLIGWQYFIAGPQMKADQARQAAIAQTQKPSEKQSAGPAGPVLSSAHLSRADAVARSGARIAIDTPSVEGSLRLIGARFDDLKLKNYHESVDPKSPEVSLLTPSGAEYPYFAEFGWTASGSKTPVPGDSTPWKLVDGSVLSPGHPVTLSWDNGQGLVFTREISVDDKYMFTVADTVTNQSGAAVQLYPYALVVRVGVPKHQTWWALHEGFVGVAGDAAKYVTYGDFKDDGTPPTTFDATGGWVGITDKYWMAAVIPPQNLAFDASYRATPFDGDKTYQADYHLAGSMLKPGQTLSVTERMFAGAKIVGLLRDYEKNLGIARFDLAVDWGWFIFLTQPLFWLLDKIFRYVGNFGVAIILATMVIRILLFPLMNASFRSMSRMKKLQPEMEKLKAQFANDAPRMQQEMMELYKREKVNPMSGCLPMLVPLPILFSFYKVQLVTIEMFHAPFFGWIKDLSAPDPTTYLNLFGLLPFSVPQTLPGFLASVAFLMHVGVWPILMGVTQWVQTKMNPPATDPVQQRIFSLMPIMMTFIFATLPSGLVIYYTWNNVLSMTQQYVMMKREGVKVHLFDNLKPPAFVLRLLAGPKAQK